MNIVIDKLKAWGCDVEGALERMLNDEQFYLEMLQALTKDNVISELGDKLAAGDISSAFEKAHTLKGVSGNLGVTPVYTLACKLVEPLRAGSTENVQELYEQLKLLFEKFTVIVGTEN